MTPQELIGVYNPWQEEGLDALRDLPAFERPVLKGLLEDLNTQRQILSITGPRRVGKTTLLRQMIRHFLHQKVPANRLVYYSLDDPALFRAGVDPGVLIDELMRELQSRAGNDQVILLLDEVQRLDRWELYLKKYYDLNYRIRFVISGSAAAPIFKRSRESLLGRVKDYHLLPFTFREFLLFKLHEYPALVEELERVHSTSMSLAGMVSGDPKHKELQTVTVAPLSNQLWETAQQHFGQYVNEGGFPEVWSLPTFDQKIEYLYDNQVKKVIYEDLVLAAEFRKPEQLKRFYLSLLEKPGREVNLSAMASETGIGIQQVEKYLPLLEMTDLITHIGKFRKSALRVRRGNMKFYLVDLALRNAVLRLRDPGSDPDVMGVYAENLVFNALRTWRGALAIDYYRDRDGEIDFIVHTGPQTYLPVEVKYRDSLDACDWSCLERFSLKFHVEKSPLIVSKNRHDFGRRRAAVCIPLLHFLLLFD